MLETNLKICKALNKYEYEYAEHKFGTDVPAWANNMQEFRILNISEEDKEKIVNDIDKILPKGISCEHQWYENTEHKKLFTVLVLQIRKLPEANIKDLINEALRPLREEYGIIVECKNYHYVKFYGDDDIELVKDNRR